MYNKGLNCRFKHAGRQGRSKNKLRFPRHIINRYEGTHLPMKKTYSGWDEWHGPWINYHHVNGLINKFVGKPYDKFIKVWHAKLKKASEYIRQTYSLQSRIDLKPTTHRWYSVKFYVDSNGIIRKYPQNVRHRYRSELTKHQRKCNDNVKIPNLGVCKNSSPYNYEFLNYHSKQNPIMLGEFYVCFADGTVKVPVYTCCQELMISYYNASNIEDFIRDRDLKYEEKKRNITNTWIPIKRNPWFSNPITKNLDGQHIFVQVPNNSRRRLMETLASAIRNKLDDKDIERLKNTIARTPITETRDIGYGNFYLFVKRKDIEKAKDT